MAGNIEAWGANRAAAEGVPYTHEVYPDGAQGVRKSLTEMSRLIREARNDKDVNGYAGDVLKAAGLDGRNPAKATVRARTQALLDEVRAVTIYSPDPHGTEMITSPAGQLCLRPGLCIRKSDCDDLSTLLCALCLCVGIQAYIVKQSWGPDKQEHVLVAVVDENGDMLKADPSHKDLPVGRSVQANEEMVVDPMEQVGSIGTAGAEIVTFGAISATLGHGGHGGGVHHGGHHGGGGGHHGGHGHRQFHDGHWWDWNGSDWDLIENEAVASCSRWGDPLRNPPQELLVQAASQLAASGDQPVSDEWTDGTTYLFTREGGAVLIRPCIAAGVAGFGSAEAVGLGLFTIDDIMALDATVDGQMESTNTAASGCSALSPADLQAWAAVYNGWKTGPHAGWQFYATTPHSKWDPSFVAAEYVAIQDLVPKMQNYAAQIPGFQQRIHTACQNYQPATLICPNGLPAPGNDLSQCPPAPGPGPGVDSGLDWVDQLKSGAKAVVVTGVALVGIYAVYKAVKFGGEVGKNYTAGKAARKAVAT